MTIFDDFLKKKVFPLSIFFILTFFWSRCSCFEWYLTSKQWGIHQLNWKSKKIIIECQYGSQIGGGMQWIFLHFSNSMFDNYLACVVWHCFVIKLNKLFDANPKSSIDTIIFFQIACKCIKKTSRSKSQFSGHLFFVRGYKSFLPPFYFLLSIFVQIMHTKKFGINMGPIIIISISVVFHVLVFIVVYLHASPSNIQMNVFS